MFNWSQLANALPAGIYACDGNGRVVECNRLCASFWGRSPVVGSDGEFAGVSSVYCADGRALPPSEWPVAQVLSGRAVRGRELVIERADGTRIRLEADAEPVLDERGGVLGALCTLKDVTASNGAEARRERERQADLQAARLAAIVASSDDAIVSKTLDGVITSWNAGATRIFGYRSEEMIGQHITKIIPKELYSEEESILARLRAGQHIDHFETVRVARDGRRIDVSVTVSPIRDRSGKLVGASKVGRDITERKQAERTQRLLVSELNHRVKNTLATVQSIANQTVYRARGPADFATSFAGRIEALARTHILLSDSTWRGADLTALVNGVVAIGERGEGRIAVSGPSVILNPQAALHLGLVLHELATNARKYGALSSPRGRLSIKWAVRESAERQLMMEWRESGGPAVNVPQSRGFGMTLIEKSLDAHGGSAAVRYETEGLVCDVTLRLQESELQSAGAYCLLPVATDAKAVQKERGDRGVEGRRILVVDDEPLVAMDIAASLEDEGCEIVGPAATLDKAMLLVANSDFDAALLDANLSGSPVDTLAAALFSRKIPFAFVSGYGREGLPEAFRQVLLIRKPFQRQSLVDAVRQMVLPANPDVQIEKSV